LAALPDDPGALLVRLRELAGATDPNGQVPVYVDGFRQTIRLPPKGAIQAIKVSANWFAAEFAEPGQARVEIVTKAGAADVHAEVIASGNDEAWNARNALADRRPDGSTRNVTGYISGPIVRGRWSFVAYGGNWLQRRTAVIDATVVEGRSPTPVPYVSSTTAPDGVTNGWLGTAYQISRRHSLSVSVSRTTEHADNQGLESGLDLPERAFRRDDSDTTWRLALLSAPSDRVVSELRAQIDRRPSTVAAASSAPAVLVLDAFNGGGNQNSLFTATRHLDVEVTEDVTVSTSRHLVKVGVDAEQARHNYVDRSNFGGVFVFGADYDRDAAGVPLLDGQGRPIPISPLENYRRSLLLHRRRRSRSAVHAGRLRRVRPGRLDRGTAPHAVVWRAGRLAERGVAARRRRARRRRPGARPRPHARAARRTRDVLRADRSGTDARRHQARRRASAAIHDRSS
jgi:hypothetical protein